MSDCIDTWVQTVQASTGEPAPDRLVPKPERFQLFAPHHSMLALGDLGDPRVWSILLASLSQQSDGGA